MVSQCISVVLLRFCCRIELANDHITSYLDRLRNELRPGITKMVVCILPNYRKDRYDAIKIHLSVENAGALNTVV